MYRGALAERRPWCPCPCLRDESPPLRSLWLGVGSPEVGPPEPLVPLSCPRRNIDSDSPSRADTGGHVTGSYGIRVRLIEGAHIRRRLTRNWQHMHASRDGRSASRLHRLMQTYGAGTKRVLSSTAPGCGAVYIICSKLVVTFRGAHRMAQGYPSILMF